MEDSPNSRGKKPASWGEWTLASIAVLIALSVIFYVFANREAIGQFFREAHYQPLGIATVPSGAVVMLDGNEIGTSPITVNTAPGPHTLIVRKEGFKESSLALNLERDHYERGENRTVRLVHAAAPWIVNIELEPIPDRVAVEKPLNASPNPASNDIARQAPSSRTEPTQSNTDAGESIAAKLSLIEQRVQIIDDKANFAATIELTMIGILIAIFLTLAAQVAGHFRK